MTKKKTAKILEQLEDPPGPAPDLAIIVDFNQLHGDHGNDAFELIGKLKDLLR